VFAGRRDSSCEIDLEHPSSLLPPCTPVKASRTILARTVPGRPRPVNNRAGIEQRVLYGRAYSNLRRSFTINTNNKTERVATRPGSLCIRFGRNGLRVYSVRVRLPRSLKRTCSRLSTTRPFVYSNVRFNSLVQLSTQHARNGRSVSYRFVDTVSIGKKPKTPYVVVNDVSGVHAIAGQRTTVSVTYYRYVPRKPYGSGRIPPEMAYAVRVAGKTASTVVGCFACYRLARRT